MSEKTPTTGEVDIEDGAVERGNVNESTDVGELPDDEMNGVEAEADELGDDEEYEEVIEEVVEYEEVEEEDEDGQAVGEAAGEEAGRGSDASHESDEVDNEVDDEEDPMAALASAEAAATAAEEEDGRSDRPDAPAPMVSGELDSLSSIAASSGPGPTSTRRTSTRRVNKKQNPLEGIRATAIPVFLTIGFMLLVPSYWSVRVLGGGEPPWGIGAGRSNIKSMARVMLVSAPLSLILLGAGGVFLYQHLNEQKDAKKQAGR